MLLNGERGNPELRGYLGCRTLVIPSLLTIWSYTLKWSSVTLYTDIGHSVCRHMAASEGLSKWEVSFQFQTLAFHAEH